MKGNIPISHRWTNILQPQNAGSLLDHMIVPDSFEAQSGFGKVIGWARAGCDNLKGGRIQ